MRVLRFIGSHDACRALTAPQPGKAYASAAAKVLSFRLFFYYEVLRSLEALPLESDKTRLSVQSQRALCLCV